MSTFPWACFFGCYYNESFDKYKIYHKSPAEEEAAFVTGKKPQFIPFLQWTVNRQHQDKKKDPVQKKSFKAESIKAQEYEHHTF